MKVFVEIWQAFIDVMMKSGVFVKKRREMNNIFICTLIDLKKT